MRNEVTAQLADFAATIRHTSLPTAVTDRVKALILDIVGITLRARHDVTPRAAAARGRTSRASARPLHGARRRSHCRATCRGADQWCARSFARFRRYARSCIAASERADRSGRARGGGDGRRSGRDLIAAIVAGYEIQIRLSLALVPTDHLTAVFIPQRPAARLEQPPRRDACSVCRLRKWPVPSAFAGASRPARCSSSRTVRGTSGFTRATPR